MTSYSQPPTRRWKLNPFLIYSVHLETKVKVKMQRIRPGVVWNSARIDIIDSLSAFYVENLDPQVHLKYTTMFEELQ